MKQATVLVLLAALCLSCLSAVAEEAVKYTNDGLTLSVPSEWAELLLVETPENDPEGILFTVSEEASIEAADDEEMKSVAGFLFSIQRVTDFDLEKMLVQDMSGKTVFALNPVNAFEKFLLRTPTDYRFMRNSYESAEEEARYLQMNKWARSDVPEIFIRENNLMPKHYGNSEMEMHFARIVFEHDDSYTLTMLEGGTVHPSKEVETENLAVCFVEEATYEKLDPSETPDGEYVVMLFDDGCRFDFFLSGEDPNIIRHTWNDGQYMELFRVHFLAQGEDERTAADIMTDWYQALLKYGK
ncbi:MAG: hypothetical protein K5746_00285 [Clostridiales bacterium]|nr:hypothetical protein [Clostridiales bacterium]